MNYKRRMKNNDIFDLFFEHELNNNVQILKDVLINSLIENKTDNLQDNNKKVIKISPIEDELNSKKNQKFLKKKRNNNEFTKLKNRESAKRYRERHRLAFSSMLNENKLLQDELKSIIEIVKRKICPFCKRLKLEKQCQNIIKKKEKALS